MSWDGQLTRGAIQRIENGDSNLTPVLQIIDLTNLPRQKDRYRVVLSDSVHYQQSFLHSELNDLVYSHQIDKYNVIRLTEFTVNVVTGKKVIVILGLEVVSKSPGGEIGSPQNIYKRQQQQQPQASGGRPNPYAQNQAQGGPSGGPSGGRPGFGGRPSGGGGGGGGGYNMPRNSMNDARVVPVASLNPYRNSWVIKVRCTSKGDIRHWSNDRGDGKLMSIDLIDKNDCEIRCTMFKEAVDKFEPLFAKDKVYYISKGKIKVANKRWTHIPHDYEITLDTNSVVELVHGDDPSIKSATFDFKPIGTIENVAENSFIDILGIVKKVDDLRQIESQKTQKVIQKRQLTLHDQSGAIELTLWAQNAEKYTADLLKDSPVLAVKAARVSTFSGKSLSTSHSSVLAVSPDLPEAHSLKGWWDNGGANQQVKVLTQAYGGQRQISPSDPRHTFAEVQSLNLGRRPDGKPDFFVLKGTITALRHDVEKRPWYKACSRQRDGKQCNKRVNEENGDYRCEMCNAVGPEFENRFILSFTVNDYSGTNYMSCFDDLGQELLGIDANKLNESLDSGDESLFNRTFKEANWKTKLFKLRAKTENYQDAERLKLNVIGMEDIDYQKESYDLISKINAL